jgi:phage-related minor tail protein
MAKTIKNKLKTGENSKAARMKPAYKLAAKNDVQKRKMDEQLKRVEIRLEKLVKSIHATTHQAKRNSEDVQKLILEIADMHQEMALLETKADADRKLNLIMQALDGLSARINIREVEKHY